MKLFPYHPRRLKNCALPPCAWLPLPDLPAGVVAQYLSGAGWPLPGPAAAEGDGLSFPTPWDQRGER